MRRTIVILLCLICALLVNAKEKNYIYVFDCTQSMDTEFHIWEKAKQWLKDDIMRKREDAMISIVPFRDNCDGLISPFLRKNMDWGLLESRFETLISSPHNKTGICRAWDEAVKYIRPDCDNWFILLTDGDDGYEGSAGVKKRMRDWCQYHTGCNAYVVTLSATARQALWTDLSNCDDIDMIDGSDFIPIIGTFDNSPMSMLANCPHNFLVHFSEDGHFKAHVVCDDSFYEVFLKNNDIINEEACIIIKEKREGERPIDNHQIYFTIVSDDDDVQFRKSDFVIKVDTRDLANVDFAKPSNSEYRGEKIKTYSKFLLWPGKDWGETVIDLGSCFNQQAKIKKAIMHFNLYIPKEIGNECKILLDGKDVGQTFDVCNDNSKLTIRISHKLPESAYTFVLKAKGENIESVNAEIGDSYKSEVRFKHVIVWNPLLTISFWFGVIIVVMSIARILYSHLRKGIYAGIDYFYKGNQEVLVKKRKCNRIILSQKPRKQKIIDWLFNGKTLYNIEPIQDLRSEVKLKAAGRKRRIMRARFCPNNDYLFDGMKLRKQIISSDEDVKHTISDNEDNTIITFKFY